MGLALILGLIVWKRKRMMLIFFGNRHRKIKINSRSNHSNREIVGPIHTNMMRELTSSDRNFSIQNSQKSESHQNGQNSKNGSYFPSESQSGLMSDEL